jgi:hypothetical protein
MRTEKYLCSMAIANGGLFFYNWYDISRVYVKQAADCMGVCPDRFTDILALVSPRTRVVRSMRVGIHYCMLGRWLPAVLHSTKQAVRHYEDTGEIRGPKTSVFAAALKGDPEAVVLDTWMAKAFEIPQREFDKKKVRQECARRLGKVAKSFAISPAQAQAAVWAGIVSKSGRRVKYLDVGQELQLWDIE